MNNSNKLIRLLLVYYLLDFTKNTILLHNLNTVAIHYIPKKTIETIFTNMNCIEVIIFRNIYIEHAISFLSADFETFR